MNIEITDRDYWARICDRVMELGENWGTKFNDKLKADEEERAANLSRSQRFWKKFWGSGSDEQFFWNLFLYPTPHHSLYYKARDLLAALNTEGTGRIVVDAKLLDNFLGLVEKGEKDEANSDTK